jgi:hypothetical protein
MVLKDLVVIAKKEGGGKKKLIKKENPIVKKAKIWIVSQKHIFTKKKRNLN